MPIDNYEKEILRRLDMLIALQLEQPYAEGAQTMSAKVQRLHALGLPPSEIARILNKPSNYVSAILTTVKARKKKIKTND